MKTCTALLVLAVAATASAAVGEESRHQQELREHYHHLSYIADYSCHHPQPRTVPVHELLSPYQTRGKAYFPEYTVLHRCDMFAGCCEGGGKCGPIHADNIHLPFKVTYLEDMGDKRKGEWEMEYASFDNHTHCGCVDRHGVYHEEKGHKDHHKHSEDHDHHEHEDHHHNHEDHDSHEEHDRKPKPVYKEEYPPNVKVPGRRPSSEEDSYSGIIKSGKRPESNSGSKKIDSLYITI